MGKPGSCGLRGGGRNPGAGVQAWTSLCGTRQCTDTQGRGGDGAESGAGQGRLSPLPLPALGVPKLRSQRWQLRGWAAGLKEDG